MQAVLTILDTTGIQDYIFGSNRLRENVVASHLVELATGAWVAEVLPQPHNLDALHAVRAGWHLEDEASRQAELIYRGGGNVVLLFRSLEVAQATVGQLSLLLLARAPGLHLVAAHEEFLFRDDATATPSADAPLPQRVQAIGGDEGVYARLMQQLARAKQRQRSSLGLLAQSVVQTCRSTGLPAVASDPEEPTRPVSAAVAAKVNRVRRDEADERLRTLLREAAGDDPAVLQEIEATYALSRDVDDLGRSHGDLSYLAVVHADANGMGLRFKALMDQYAQPHQNRTCLNQLRALSQSLNDAGARALRTTVRLMLEAFRQPHFKAFCEGLTTTRQDGQRTFYLPFRPLVFGGDDVTFVCDGRLGLTLAATYLTQFAHEARHLADGKPAFACAGVAIVKTHYPFARAYELCDALCKRAKHLVRETSASGEGTALDWYLATTGIMADLDDLRTRYYRVPQGHLELRPVRLDGTGWRTWANVDQTLQTLLYDEQWRDRRNKVV
ncbi:MAG: hypothetical protein EOM24_22965, partial [Chloroflexia bacterium]|nr:hypothetical protein [Chloroflexia bacterium]